VPAPPAAAADRISGLLAVALTAAVILHEWHGGALFGQVAAGLAAILVPLLALGTGWGRRVFVALGLVLVAIAIAARPDWPAPVGRALASAAFIAAFFTALTSLRHAAETSPAIGACGRFLAAQPPGRRYGALTLGGHLFGLLLNYGAIALLGSLAMTSAAREPDEEIRRIRVRRMLLAIQRGFVATLTWSPLAFAMAISTTLVPGASWAAAVPYCAVSGLILAGLGWTLDSVFKPRLATAPPPRAVPEGSWASLLPLLALLALLGVAVGGLHLLTGLRAVAVVILVVPLVSAAWVGLQAAPGSRAAAIRRRSRDYALRDLPRYRGEMVILMMAGFIGTLGAALVGPAAAASGLDLSGLPAWVILVALVWIIPLTGQAGMNPILSVSLIAPILPAPAAMGVTPPDVIVAITAGWALSGASSPYTATTLMVGALGEASAAHVGLRWNGAYTLLGAVLLSGWVALVALT
jgi:hypothetical protein